MIMNTLFNNENKDMAIKPIGKNFGLERINTDTFILYRSGIPDKQVEFKTSLDKRIFAVDLVLKHEVIKSRVADALDVTRKTIDVWLETYQRGGNAALVNSTKKGSGRKKQEDIVRPLGNKFNEYEAHKKEEREREDEVLSL